jgi:plastocyanin
VIGGLAIAALALAAGAPQEAGVQREVLIPGKFFSPSRQVVLIGDTVTWRNQDSSSHTATAADGAFDSGNLAPGAIFSQTFTAAGIHAYVCRIHRYMRAEVDVYGLALSAPGYAVPFGAQTSLGGLAPPAAGQVTIRRRDVGGTSFVDVGTVPVAADGSFRYPLTANASASFQAVAGALSSATEELRVAARLTLDLARKGRSTSLIIRTDPAQTGAIVELQKYVFERFDFRTLRRARLNGGGAAVLRVKPRSKLHVRALLRTGVRGYGRAVSTTILVRPPGR